MIRIVIPFYSEFETVKPGLRAMRESGIPHEVLPSQGADIADNRNAGVNMRRSLAKRQPADAGFSHFLFIDSDIGFNPEHVRQLLKMDQAITALPYLTHRPNGEYQAGSLDASGAVTRRIGIRADGVRAVDFVGAGFLLVRRDVFPRLEYPWFRFGVGERGDTAWNLSEDVGFCLNAKRNGYSIYCDFDHPVYHKPRSAEDFNVRY